MKAEETLLPASSRRTLQRNTHRRRLGGVCAGIADYLGMNPTLVRFLFILSVFFSFSLTLWIYLALWFVLPARADLPIPEVSWHLARELRRTEKRLRKVHRRLESDVADLAQEAFEAIKVLAPYFEETGAEAVDGAIRETALQRFPKLLDRLLALPGGFGPERRVAERSPAGLLLLELREVHERLRSAADELVTREFRKSFAAATEFSPELATWREQLAPLQARLAEQARPETLAALRGIEDKLAFLLERIGDGDLLMDLRPFEVRKIAFDYLPDALNQYLALPSSMAQSQPLLSGKTAEESLNEQLNLLDTALADLARSLFQKDAQSLVVHGRFLKEKFAEQPFRLAD